MGSNKKFDKVIVLDCEMSCWADKQEQGAQRPEIIQIGICLLNMRTACIEEEQGYYIKPKYSVVSEYCTALTNITPKMAKSGISLSDACNSIMKNYGSRNRIIATFGNDTKKFREDCLLKNAEYPFGQRIIDVSIWFHLKDLMSNTNVGLMDCLKIAGLQFDGRQHDAVCDARNTARLLIYLTRGRK
ncbi:MAG: 3'-5' exonuclease [Patescibacteria group bacterium]